MWLCAVACAGAIISACGAADRTVILECPSPDGAAKAIFWAYSAGPAAGVGYFVLDVVPVHRDTRAVIEAREEERSDVMTMSGGGTVQLTWLTSKRLLVEYPEDARLDLAAPGWPVYAKSVPNLRVVYRGSDDIEDFSASTCMPRMTDQRSPHGE
jgi:hypothetical protein